ncbi:hypothetical protein MRX96_034514 [Rhipicephalus microplus]
MEVTVNGRDADQDESESSDWVTKVSKRVAELQESQQRERDGATRAASTSSGCGKEGRTMPADFNGDKHGVSGRPSYKAAAKKLAEWKRAKAPTISTLFDTNEIWKNIEWEHEPRPPNERFDKLFRIAAGYTTTRPSQQSQATFMVKGYSERFLRSCVVKIAIVESADSIHQQARLCGTPPSFSAKADENLEDWVRLYEWHLTVVG